MSRVATLASIGMLIASVASVHATDHPQDALKIILKQAPSGAKKAVWVTKLPAVVLPTTNPMSSGATLTIRGVDETQTASLPAANWAQNGAGTVYKFVNKDAPGGPSPVKVSVIKSGSVLKVVAKDTLIALDDAAQGTVSVALAVDSDVYCSECTAPLKDEVGKYIAKGCIAPIDCSALAPTTTTTTTTTSTTTTTIGSFCCDLPSVPSCFDSSGDQFAAECVAQGGTVNLGPPACDTITGTCSTKNALGFCCECPGIGTATFCSESASFSLVPGSCASPCTLFSTNTCMADGTCGGTAPTTTTTTTTTSTTTTTMGSFCCALPTAPSCFDSSGDVFASECVAQGGTVNPGPPACNGTTGACSGTSTSVACCECPGINTSTFCSEGAGLSVSGCTGSCTLTLASSCGPTSGTCGGS